MAWTPSTTPGTTVNVYRASSACSNPFIKVASNVGPSGPYSEGPLPPGGVFAYQVTAVLAGVESSPSNCVIVTIPVPTPTAPAAPTNLTVTPQ